MKNKYFDLLVNNVLSNINYNAFGYTKAQSINQNLDKDFLIKQKLELQTVKMYIELLDNEIDKILNQ